MKDLTEYQKMPYHKAVSTEPKQTESMQKLAPDKAKVELKIMRLK